MLPPAVPLYPGFAACHSAPLELESDSWYLHVFIDRFSVEVFANHGLVCLTDSIFPSPSSQGLEFFAEGSQVTLSTLDIWQLEPASFTYTYGL